MAELHVDFRITSHDFENKAVAQDQSIWSTRIPTRNRNVVPV